MPSKSLRAVRTTAERTARGGVGVGVHDDVDQQVAGGVLDVDLRAVARPIGGELVPDRAGQQHAGDHAHRGEHADRGVRLHRDERAGADLAAVAGRGEQRRLRHRRRGHVAEAHELPRLAAERVDPFEQRPCRAASSSWDSSPREAERLGHREHDGHAVVDAGDLDAVDRVPHVAGGQQAAGGRALGVGEREHDRRGRAGHAGDGDVAAVLDPAVGGRRRWRRRCCRS